NAGLVRSLGAEAVVDYAREDFTRGGRTYDVVFDVVGRSSFARCRGVLAPGGVYLTTAPSPGILLRTAWPARSGRRHARVAFTGLRPAREKAADLRYLSELVAAGRIAPVV